MHIMQQSSHLLTSLLFAESPCIVVAAKFLPELNKLPEDVLSFSAASQEASHSSFQPREIGS